MPVFTYSALKSDGSLTKGEVTANDRAEAMRRLDRSGLQPVSLSAKDSGGVATAAPPKKAAEPKKPEPKADGKKPEPSAKVASKDGGTKNGAVAGKAPAKKPEADAKPARSSDSGMTVPTGPIKLKRKEIVMFTEEISDLLGAGLQLEPALRIMESRDEQGSLKLVSALLRQKVRDGSSFSAALRSSSPSFGELYCSMASAGEISGALGVILRRQAVYLKALGELQSRVVTALIYPAFLFAAGVLVSVLFITVLIPQLAGLLKQSNKKLPPVAEFMLGVGDFFKDYWWAILFVVALIAWLFQYFTTNARYRPTWDRIKLSLPMVGPLFSGRFYVQFLETLANLVDNGLPLLRAMELTCDATQNLFLRGLLEKVNGMVAEGGSLSKAIKRVGFFPSLLSDMVNVGEQTGDLPMALRKTAERFDKDLEKKIERIQAMIPHLVTVIMAAMVGSVAYMMIGVIMESITGIKGGK